MRIVIFNTFYYPKFVGGAEISVKLLAEKLTEVGHEVFVVTTGEMDKREVINGVTVIRFRQRNFYSQHDTKERNFLLKLLWHALDSCNPFYQKKLSALLVELKPDVVHTNNIQGFSPLIWKIIKKRKIPLVHTLRDYYLLCHRSNMFNKGQNCNRLCVACSITHNVKKQFFNYPDTIVGVSNFILQKHQDYIHGISQKKTRTVYNAVDVPMDFKQKEINGLVCFGYMGRISADKGVGYMVDEVLKLKAVFPKKFRLVLAGKGKENFIISLKDKLEGLDYQFLGVVDPSEFYKLIDVCIVPSKWNEPFGRVAVESLAHGTPACLAGNGGLREIHHENCTWLFKPGEIELSTLLKQILADPNSIMEKQLHTRKYASSFSSDIYVNNYQKIYVETKNG